MSKTIDTRVVEMKFDNTNFEKNTKQSMSTLEKLKEKLKFGDSSKALEDLGEQANRMNFNGLVGSVEVVHEKFNALEAIAVGALMKIGSQATVVGEQLIKSLTVDNISDGWNKYEQKTQNVQTLINSTGKSMDDINGYLKKLMWYSDETSFGFTDMTSALSTMTSSGGDIEKLIPMIEGIGNATAYAGKGAAEFSRVIYNLNQSYSQGALNTMDWRSVEMAGAASKQLKTYLIEAAEQVGTIKKGTGDIAEWATYLSKKKITSEAMEIAFTRFASYTDAIKQAVDDGTYETATEAMAAMSTDGFDEVAVSAFNSAQNAKSFTEAIDATKDAVSSGWMSIFETIFGNYEQQTQLWTDFCGDLWDIFASGFEGKQNFLNILLGDNWTNFSEKVENAGVSMETFESTLTDLAKSQGINMDYMVKKYGSFGNALANLGNRDNLVRQALYHIASGNEAVAATSDAATDKLKDLNKIVDKVIKGGFGNGKDRYNKLTAAGYEYAEVQALVNKRLKGQEITIKDLTDAQLESVGYTEEQIKRIRELGDEAFISGSEVDFLIETLNKPSGRDLLIESASNLLHGLMDRLQLVKQAWDEVFGSATLEETYNVLESIRNLTASFRLIDDETGEVNSKYEKLLRTLKGVFSIVKLVARNVKYLFNGLVDLAKAMGFVKDGLYDAAAGAGDFLSNLNTLDEENHKFKNLVDKVVDTLKSFINKIKDSINPLKSLWERVKALSILKELGEYIRNKFNTGLNTLTNNGEKTAKIGQKISDVIAKIKSFSLIEFLDDVVSFFERLHLDETSEEIVIMTSNLSGLTQEVKTLTKSADQSNAINNMRINFSKWGDTLGYVFDKIKEKTSKVDTKQAVQIGGLFGMIFALYKIVTVLKTILAILKTAPFNALNGMFGSIEGFFKQLKKSVKAGMIIKIALAVAILAGAVAGLATIDPERLNAATKAVIGLVGAVVAMEVVTAVLMHFAEKLSAIDVAMFAKVAQYYSEAILMLSAALFILSKTEYDWKDLGVLAAMLVGMVAIMNAMPKSLPSNGITLMAFATGLLELTGVLWLISKMDIPSIYKGLITMLPVMLVMLIISKLMGSHKEDMVSNSGLNLLAFAASLWLVSKVLSKIVNNNDLDKVKDNLDKLAVVIGTMIALVAATRLAGPDAKGAGIGLLAMSGALWVMAQTLHVFDAFDGKELLKAELAMGGVVAMMAALLMATGYAMGADIKGLTLALLSAAGLVIALIQLTSYDWKDLFAGATAISAVLFAYGYMLSKIGEMNSDLGSFFKSIFVVIAAIVSCYALAGALKLLAENDWKSMAAAALGLAACMAAMGYALSVIGNIDGKRYTTMKADFIKAAAVSLVIAGLAVGAFAAALQFMKIDYRYVITATGALSVAVLAMAAAARIIGGKSVHIGMETAKSFLVMSFVLIVAGIAVGITAQLLNGISFDTVASSVGSLVVVILAMSAAAKILSTINSKIDGSVLGSIFVLSIVMIFAAAAVGLLANMLPENLNANGLLAAVTGICEVILAVTVAGAIMSKIPLDPSVVLQGVLSIAVIIFGIIAIISAIAVLGMAINDYGNIGDIISGLDSVGQMLTKCCEIIGEMISSFAVGLTSGLPKIADNITEFIDHLKPAFESAKEIGNESKEGMINLVECLALLAAAELLTAIDTLLGFLVGKRSMKELGRTLSELAGAVYEFYDYIKDKDINNDKFKKFVDCSGYLIEIANLIPRTGGLIQWFAGESDLSKFGRKCKSFAESLVDLEKLLTANTYYLQPDVIKLAKECAEPFVELANEIPGIGGLMQTVFGESDLREFGYRVLAFSQSLVDVAKWLACNTFYLNEDNFALAQKCANHFVELANEIPKNGDSVMKLIEGDNAIDVFGERIRSFIDQMIEIGKLSYTLKEDDEAITAAVGTSRKIVNLANLIISSNHDYSIFDEWGKTAKAWSNSMAAIANNLSMFDATNIDSAVVSARKIIGIAQELDSNDGSNLKMFSEGIEALAKSNLDMFCLVFEDSADRVTAAVNTMIKAAIDTVQAYGEDGGFYSAGTAGALNLTYGFRNTLIDQHDMIISYITNHVITVIKSLAEDFKTCGQSLILRWMAGMTGSKSTIENMSRTVGSYAYNTLNGNEMYQKFYTAGENLVKGLIKGMLDHKEDAYNAGNEIGNEAKKGYDKATDTNSPSREFYNRGMYLVAGLVNAVADNVYQAYNSGYDVGEQAVNGINDSIRSISDIVTDEIDMNPVITPRLDLSNVTAGVNRMNTMFNDAHMSGTVDSNQNGGSGSLGGATYSFVQNNYSPKALNRTEIYRQTRNQLSQLKGAVNSI